MTDWASLREEFPLLEHTAYLNACSLGPMPRRARAALQRYVEAWDRHGSLAWFEAWLPVLQRLRERIGELLRTPAGTVALAPSVSTALLIMANALLARTPRRKVLVGRLDFPTVGYQFLSRPDLCVEFVESEDGVTIPPEAFAARIDERTALVATTHVLFTTGYLQEVAALAEVAHRWGAALLIDGYHSVGCVPVDLGALGCDVFVAGSLKFLSGGPGTAFIACRPELVDALQPVGTGWMGTKDFLAFRVDEAVPEDDARRFETGTWAVPAHYAALAALELILEVGVERISGRLHDLTDLVFERCDDAGLCTRTPRERRPGDSQPGAAAPRHGRAAWVGGNRGLFRRGVGLEGHAPRSARPGGARRPSWPLHRALGLGIGPLCPRGATRHASDRRALRQARRPGRQPGTVDGAAARCLEGARVPGQLLP